MRVCRACVAAAVEAAVSPLPHHGGVVEVGAGEAPGVVPNMMIDDIDSTTLSSFRDGNKLSQSLKFYIHRGPSRHVNG